MKVKLTKLRLAECDMDVRARAVTLASRHHVTRVSRSGDTWVKTDV